MKEQVLILDDKSIADTIERHLMPGCFHVSSMSVEALSEEVVSKLPEQMITALYYEDNTACRQAVEMLTNRGIAPVIYTQLQDETLRTALIEEGVTDYIVTASAKMSQAIPQAIERLRKNKAIKVLIVDDSRVFRAIIRALLEFRYYRLFEVEDGVEALSVIENEPDIRLVITDYKMPKMDGLELTTAIRKTHDKDRMAIIALSAESNSNVTANFLHAGANDYVIKPFNQEEFSSRIANTLERIEQVEAITKNYREIEEKNRQILQNQVILDQYKEAIDDSSIVSKTDTDGVITYVNDAFCKISGFGADELIGNTHRLVKHPDTPKKLFEELWSSLKSNRLWQGMIQNRTKEGGSYFVSGTILPLLDKDGEAIEYISILQDLTKVIDQEERIRKQITDRLTGLPNRQKLIEDLQETQSGVLSIVNIDGFGKINDFFGQNNGDRILVEFGHRIAERLDDTAQVYHLQADEYAVFRNAATLEACREQIEENMRALTETPFLLHNEQIFLEVSVGLAEGDTSELIIQAGVAMKQARLYRERLRVYEPSMLQSDQFEQNLHYLQMLKTAIANDKLVPYYQPIVNMENGKIEKYECLVRLIDESGNVTSPLFFLDVAKQAKLYHIITERVIEKSFALFADLELEFSINLSVDDIGNERTMTYLKEKIVEHGVGKRLALEIVEQEGIEDMSLVQSFLSEIREYGCKISIDDFGTGYSNFGYLIDLDVDYIKIDGSIIKKIVEDKNSRLIAQTINDFSRHLKSKTIAEFVCSAEIHALLKEMGVDYAQGFWLGEPLPDIVRG